MSLPVTVVIPAFNAQRYIGKALQSLVDSTPPPAQILVVDDGSTDATAAQVTDMMDRHPFINLERQDNAGNYAARRRGALAATQDIICVMDADDVFLPDGLQRLYTAITQSEDTIAAYGRISAIDANGEPYESPTPSPFMPSGNVLEALLCSNFVAPGVMIRKAAFTTMAENVSLRRGADWIMWCYAAAQGKFAAVHGAPVMLYRVHDANLTAQAVDNIDEYLRWVDIIYQDPLILGALTPERIPLLKRQSRARLHAYSGCRYLKLRRFSEARRHFSTSLRCHPLNVKRMMLWLLACVHWLPAPVKRALR